MPELSTDKLKALYIAASLVSCGKHLLIEENIYLKVYVRLVDKACNEYNFSREYLLEEIDDNKHSDEREYRTISIFGFWDHIENCINAIKRIYLIFDRIKSVKGNLNIDKEERILIEKEKTIIVNMRDTVEHLDEKLQSIDTYAISINSTQDGISIYSFNIKFYDLHKLLERFKKIGKEWIKIYSKVNGYVHNKSEHLRF